MDGITWIGTFFRWMADWFPQWVQVDQNERTIKHKGWRRRRAVLLDPGIRWYWPAFTQTEGPFKIVWQPLTTSTINVMDKDGFPVAARGFAIWKIVDVLRFAVEHEDCAAMLDDLVCAAIREVLTSKSLGDIQDNSRNTTDKALLREVQALTEDYGVEIKLVRLTTFTKARMLCVMGDEAPAVIEEPGGEES